MSDKLLLGIWQYMVSIPRFVWQRQIARTAQKIEAGLGFMSKEHHIVRNFAVGELPCAGETLSPGLIAQKLNLPVARVNVILDDLEKHLTFLFRNEQGAVAWAYPVTVNNTPHRVAFSTGEVLHSA